MHERELAEYKMKLHSFESEVDKLTSRLHRALAEKDRLESKLENSQTELGKSKVELEKAASDIGRIGNWETTNQKIQRLEIENDRLRNELERSQVGAYPVSKQIYFLSLTLHILDVALLYCRPLSDATPCPRPPNWTECRSAPTRRPPSCVGLKQNCA